VLKKTYNKHIYCKETRNEPLTWYNNAIIAINDIENADVEPPVEFNYHRFKKNKIEDEKKIQNARRINYSNPNRTSFNFDEMSLESRINLITYLFIYFGLLYLVIEYIL